MIFAYSLTGIFLLVHIRRVTDTMWTAIADPTRRAVLDLLRQRPYSVNELVDALAIAQPSASKHLRVLRAAGLVTVATDAQRRIYALDPAPMNELDTWLAPYRELWNDRLDALGRHLDATAPRRRTKTKEQKS
jgi:DNA-binding transcriptional ArsR family regulator